MADLIEQAFGDTLGLLNESGAVPTEAVTFTPTGGSPRTIPATVIRSPADKLMSNPRGPDTWTSRMEVYAANSADPAAGMTVAEAQGGGTITVAWRYGGTATAHRFAIIDTTASEIRLRL